MLYIDNLFQLPVDRLPLPIPSWLCVPNSLGNPGPDLPASGSPPGII